MAVERPRREELTFERFAGLCSILVGLGAIVYAVLFITIVEGNEETKPWFIVLLGGAILGIPVMVALYRRLRAFDDGYALTALVLGLLGSLGGILHAGYELASLETPSPQGYYPGPEAISKGVLRYLVAGLALLLIAWLISESDLLPGALAYPAGLGGVLLVVIYFGRLFDFITPGDYASLIPPILYGFVVHPIFYGWLGLVLWRTGRQDATSARA